MMEGHARVFRSMMLVSGFVIVGKSAGALREVVLAASYGTQEPMDTYFLITGLATFPMAVWLGVMTAVGVPLFVRSAKASPNPVSQFSFELSMVCVVLGTAFALLFAQLAPAAISAGWLGRSAQSIALSACIAGPLSALIPIGLIIGVASARLMGSERHVNTLLEGVPALCILCAVVIERDGSATPLVLGTVVGFGIQALLLALFIPRRIPRQRLQFQFTSPLWRPFRAGLMFFALGQVAASGVGLADQLMLAGTGTGAVAIFGYANRVLSLVLGLGATAIARATLPTFADISSDKDFLRSSARFWATTLFCVGAFGALLGWISAPTAVRFLFERGAFHASDTLAVGDALKLGFLQLPFYFSGIVAVQALSAMGLYNRITIVGFVILGIKILGNLLLIPLFNVGGAMISTSIMYAMSAALLWYFVSRESYVPTGDRE